MRIGSVQSVRWTNILLLLGSALVLKCGVSADALPPKPDKSGEGNTDRPGEIALFNGKDLTNWKATNFGGEGEVHVEDGVLYLEMGDPLTGITWDAVEEIPKQKYEILVKVKKLVGDDFFCGLTFPVGDSNATFICGGWGGAVVGISSINYQDASENDTTDFVRFEDGQWYSVKIRVTENELIAWIDDQEMARVNLDEDDVMLRAGPIELSAPLGIACFQTRSAIQSIVLRRL